MGGDVNRDQIAVISTFFFLKLYLKEVSDILTILSLWFTYISSLDLQHY